MIEGERMELSEGEGVVDEVPVLLPSIRGVSSSRSASGRSDERVRSVGKFQTGSKKRERKYLFGKEKGKELSGNPLCF